MSQRASTTDLDFKEPGPTPASVQEHWVHEHTWRVRPRPKLWQRPSCMSCCPLSPGARTSFFSCHHPCQNRFSALMLYCIPSFSFKHWCGPMMTTAYLSPYLSCGGSRIANTVITDVAMVINRLCSIRCWLPTDEKGICTRWQKQWHMSTTHTPQLLRFSKCL